VIVLSFEVTKIGVLDVKIDVGALLFRGETAEFYIAVLREGVLTDPTTFTSVVLWKPDGTSVTLTPTKFDTGLYKIAWPVPDTADTGTYTLVVSASYVVAAEEYRGASMKSFLVSAKLTGWDTTLSEIKTTVTDIWGKVDTEIDAIIGYVDEVESSLATMNVNLTNIATSVADVKSYLVNTIKPSLDAIKAKTDTIVWTDISDIKGYVDEVESLLKDTTYGLSAIKTAVDTAVTTLGDKIDTAVTTLSAKIDTAVTDISSAITTAASDVKSKIDTAVTTISGEIDTAVSDIEAAITSAANDVKSKVDAAVTTISGEIDDVSAEIAALTTPLYVAASFAVIATIVSLFAVFLIRRKLVA
jgi:uncharacterized protein YqgV (UPF0045/DUF77 family)